MAKNLRENIVNEKTPLNILFTQGIFAGIGWAFGVTIGFVFITSILAFILKQVGGLPLIGDWLASIIDATLNQLSIRSPGLPQY